MADQSQKQAFKYPEKGTRAAQLIALLKRKQGATLADIVTATAWKPHTARAALTGIRKRGFTITSEKPEGKERIYHMAEQG
jgi:DNA-binding IclR family transcriptional regulator